MATDDSFYYSASRSIKRGFTSSTTATKGESACDLVGHWRCVVTWGALGLGLVGHLGRASHASVGVAALRTWTGHVLCDVGTPEWPNTPVHSLLPLPLIGKGHFLVFSAPAERDGASIGTKHESLRVLDTTYRIALLSRRRVLPAWCRDHLARSRTLLPARLACLSTRRA